MRNVVGGTRCVRITPVCVAASVIAILAAATMVFANPAGAANVAFPVGAGWTNPASPRSFEDWGFGSCNPPYYAGKAHLGADSQGAHAGESVVSMSAGTVRKIVAQDWGPGAAVGIEHVAGDGSRFLAVYGHLTGVTVAVGATVSAGQQLASIYDWKINGVDNSHVHLGIRPLANGENAANLIPWGSSTCSNGYANSYGFVNPMPWLAAHPVGSQATPPEGSRFHDQGLTQQWIKVGESILPVTVGDAEKYDGEGQTQIYVAPIGYTDGRSQSIPSGTLIRPVGGLSQSIVVDGVKHPVVDGTTSSCLQTSHVLYVVPVASESALPTGPNAYCELPPETRFTEGEAPDQFIAIGHRVLPVGFADAGRYDAEGNSQVIKLPVGYKDAHGPGVGLDDGTIVRPVGGLSQYLIANGSKYPIPGASTSQCFLRNARLYTVPADWLTDVPTGPAATCDLPSQTRFVEEGSLNQWIAIDSYVLPVSFGDAQKFDSEGNTNVVSMPVGYVADHSQTVPPGAVFRPVGAASQFVFTGGQKHSIPDEATSVCYTAGRPLRVLPADVVSAMPVGPTATCAPKAPTAVTAAAGNQQATVSWSAPPDPGASPITGYTVLSSPGGKTCASTPAQRSCAVVGLTNGTTYTFTVTATNTNGTGPASTPSPPVVPISGFYFHPLSPQRILDSRGSNGGWNAKLAQTPKALTVTGGPANVPAGAAAVVVNVTATGSSAPSFLTVYPTGGTAPGTSSLNFAAGETIPNLVTVKVGTNGQVSFANAVGTTDVIVDIVGYFDSIPADRYNAIPPARILDSRGTTGGWNTKVTAAAPKLLQVRGAGGVPASADAVIVNVTATGGTANSYLTVYPAGQPVPTASNVNFAAGQTIPNLAAVQIGVGGNISIANAVGATDVVVDVVGYFAATSGDVFHPISPTRLLDSRGTTGGWNAKLAANAPRTLTVTLTAGVPANATAVIGNTTVTGGTANSFLTVYPAGQPVPTASNVNFAAGQTIPNLVAVKVGTNGQIAFANAVGSTHVIFDLGGYFTPN